MVKSLGEVPDTPKKQSKFQKPTVEAPNIHKDDSEANIGAGFDLNEIIKPETKSRSNYGKMLSPEKQMGKGFVDALSPWVDEKAARKQNGENVSYIL